jgi:hypothetical protein
VKTPEKFDAQLLQARWVLGGIRSENWPDLAATALELGFDGRGLQQIAGLLKPTVADLANLPEQAFIDMGLQPMDEDKAIDLLIDREIPFTNSVIPKLVNAFPAFSNRWRKHVAEWGGEPAGSYNDMSQFVHFVVDDLYDEGNLNETRRAFRLLEVFSWKAIRRHKT